MEATTPTLVREEIREERSKGDLPILVAGMVGAFFTILQGLEDGTTVLVALGTALILAGMVWIGATRLYSVDDFGRWVSFVTVSFAASLGGALVQTLRVESPKAEWMRLSYVVLAVLAVAVVVRNRWREDRRIEQATQAARSAPHEL